MTDDGGNSICDTLVLQADGIRGNLGMSIIRDGPCVPIIVKYL